MNQALRDIAREPQLRPITIAIQAMGGEGGGVLADWIVDLAEHAGYIAQATSVPGVAQRTGATVYYLELFPKSAPRNQDPVLALMPVPGDVDIVLASELMEAARAVQRGFVTKDRTTLIASTHRVYAIGERIALADGRADSAAMLDACRGAARKLHAFDMAAVADATGSPLSAVLFGALAGAGTMPFPRAAYEATIRRSGIGVQASLLAFAASFEGVMQEAPASADAGPTVAPVLQAAVQELLDSFVKPLPVQSGPIIAAGLARLIDYQDKAYARRYLDRLAPFAARGGGGDELLSEVARQLALAMAYEDTIRIAELKVRSARFARVRAEIGVKDGQIFEIAEFMHPRVEEIADTLPAPLGRWLLRNALAREIVDRLTRKGRIVKTTSLRGFLLLYALASLKPMRLRSLRFAREQESLDRWLDHVRAATGHSDELAIEVARSRGLVKGYGETHERGTRKFELIMATLPSLNARSDAANILATLRKAALEEESDTALSRALRAAGF